MKHLVKKKKNIILGILFIAIIVCTPFLFGDEGCDDGLNEVEKDVQYQQKQQVSRTDWIINLSDNPTLRSRIEKVLEGKITRNPNARQMETGIGQIDTDEVRELSFPNGVNRYALSLRNEKTATYDSIYTIIENLIVSTKNDSTKSYIMQYKMERKWIQKRDINSKFTGLITKMDIDRNVIFSLNVVDGKSQETTLNSHKQGRVQCAVLYEVSTYWRICNYSHGSLLSCNDDPVPTITYEIRDNGQQCPWDRDFYTDYGDHVGATIPEYQGTGSEVVYYEIPVEISNSAENEIDRNDVVHSFNSIVWPANNPCLERLWNDLMNAANSTATGRGNIIAEIIRTLIGYDNNSEPYNIDVRFETISNASALGSTLGNVSNRHITITFSSDPYFGQYSDLYLAAALLHEIFHAYGIIHSGRSADEDIDTGEMVMYIEDITTVLENYALSVRHYTDPRITRDYMRTVMLATLNSTFATRIFATLDNYDVYNGEILNAVRQAERTGNSSAYPRGTRTLTNCD